MGGLSEADIRRINLIEILDEEYDGEVPEPPREAYTMWSETDIRAFYTSGGTERPSASRVKQEGEDEAVETYVPRPVSEEELALWFPGRERSGTKLAAGKRAKLRVLCFTPAGSSEDMYTNEGIGKRKQESPLLTWCRAHEAEVLAVQLPGRGKRDKEDFITTAQDVATTLLPLVHAAVLRDDVPYVTISHSVGTLIQFELLSLMREHGLRMPVHVFLSSFPSPALEPSKRPWRVNARLNDDDFKVECREWDTNEIIFAKTVWPGLEPLMRADFTIFDQYEYGRAGDAPFEFPLTAFCASKDRKVTRDMVAEWKTFTTSTFVLHDIDAHHLFPISVPDAKRTWLQTIVDTLESCI